MTRTRALVTGGGTGIGAAIAHRLAADGAQVWAMGRRRAPLEEVGLGVIVGDVTAAADRTAALAATGDLDVLVNCAGVGDAGWSETIDVNLTAAHELAELAAPGLTRRRGSIVNISSVAGIVAGPGEPAYAVSKAGMLMLTRALAVRLGPLGVRVNAICPGWVRTPMADGEVCALEGDVEAGYARVTKHVPLRRPGLPQEVAFAAAFLASPDASYINGAVLTVDGGMTAVDVGMIEFE